MTEKGMVDAGDVGGSASCQRCLPFCRWSRATDDGRVGGGGWKS